MHSLKVARTIGNIKNDRMHLGIPRRERRGKNDVYTTDMMR